MPELVLQLQLFTTLAMVGLIWFVQIVHYPLYDRIGSTFTEYENAHTWRTLLVVGPLMSVEALTTIALIWTRPTGIASELVWLGAGLLAVIWLATAFWQAPAHQKLCESYDPATQRWLVQSNWVRTIAWTARGVLVCIFAVQA